MSPRLPTPPVLGVCSWSLQPSGPEDLVAALRRVGLERVSLALDPIRTGVWSLDDTVRALAEAGIRIDSGMMTTEGEDYATLESIRSTGGVRPDEHWDAATFGLPLVTLHAGFLPEDPDDAERTTMIDRLRAIVDIFAAEDVAVGFETGQETAETLLAFLRDLERPQAGVNFDPANMVLYGMGDPIDAFRRLAPRVVQMHVKDAAPATMPGVWGTEVRAGSGAVRWDRLFTAWHEAEVDVPLMIEREAGDEREADIVAARDLVLSHLEKEAGT